jgi:hypothetical protein
MRRRKLSSRLRFATRYEWAGTRTKGEEGPERVPAMPPGQAALRSRIGMSDLKFMTDLHRLFAVGRFHLRRGDPCAPDQVPGRSGTDDNSIFDLGDAGRRPGRPLGFLAFNP